MGLRTLAGFRANLNIVLGEKAQFDERLDDWINDALQEMFVILDLHGRRTTGSVNTVADQETVTLPVDLIGLLVLTDTTNKKRLLKTSIENFEMFDPAKTGAPKYYARVDRDLYLHPTPDDVYPLQMVYVKEATPLVADGDVTELGAQYDRPLQMLAARSALMDLGLRDDATFYYQSAINMLNQIPSEDSIEAQAPAVGIEIARHERDLRKR